MGLESNQIVLGYSYNLWATIILAYLASRMSLQIEGFVARLVFTFLWQYVEFLQVKTLAHRDEGSR